MTAPLAIVVEDGTSASSRRLARIQTFLQTVHHGAGARQKHFPVAEVAFSAVTSRKNPIPTEDSCWENDQGGSRHGTRT